MHCQTERGRKEGERKETAKHGTENMRGCAGWLRGEERRQLGRQERGCAGCLKREEMREMMRREGHRVGDHVPTH